LGSFLSISGIWENINKIEGKPKWFSLNFYPVLAWFGSKMVAEKFFF